VLLAIPQMVVIVSQRHNEQSQVMKIDITKPTPILMDEILAVDDLIVEEILFESLHS